jgi:hypothetical protein
MSAQEIIAELPKLKPEELRLVKEKVDDLAERQRLTVSEALLEVARATAGSDEQPPKKVSAPQKTPAQILAEIAALTIEGKQDGFSGRAHDEVLYGWNRAE